MQNHWHDILYFILVPVLLNRIVGGFVADLIKKLLFKLYVKTEEDLLLWWHVRYGHVTSHPKHCPACRRNAGILKNA